MRILLLSIFFLGGCVSTEKVPVLCEPIYISPVLAPPDLPEPVTLTAPTFYVITPNNTDEVFQKEPSLFAVSSEGYEILATNIQELRKYILNLQKVVKFYKTSIEAAEQEAARKSDAANSNSSESR